MEFVDEVEARCVRAINTVFQTEHTLLNGLYIRKIFMPANSFIVSAIHNTEHPFVILKGKITVRTNFGTNIYTAPYRGITRPGTRRILFAIEDTIWETYHPTNLKSVTEIMDSILMKRKNPLLTDEEDDMLALGLQKTHGIQQTLY